VSVRELIVNADDFGLSVGTNTGIVRSHELGIVTSASLMVHGPAAAEAAAYARMHPHLDLGLHVDLGEWAYRDGEWITLYERAPAAVEIEQQLEHFRELTGRDPTHLDSHQHVHREEPVASLMAGHAARLGVPLRGSPIPYCGDFYGQTGRGEPVPEAIAVDALLRIIERLPGGITELGCHPGLDTALASTYRVERLHEVEALCDPAVRAALAREGIQLRPF